MCNAMPFLSINSQLFNYGIAPPLLRWKFSLYMDEVELWQGSKDLSLGGVDILQVYLKLW